MSQTINITLEKGCDCYTCQKSLLITSARGGCGCTTVKVPTASSSSNSPCVDCESDCDDEYWTDCMFWSAGDIPALAIKHGDKLTGIIVTLATEVMSLKLRVATLEATVNASS